MKRVYTDERFPGLEIVNEGTTVFSVIRDGQVVSSFESWEKPDGTISEACAGRRAVDYFNRLGEAEEAPVIPSERGSTEAKPTTEQIDRLMAQESLEHDPERKQALRRHLLNLMRQEESVAEAVVNHLIEAR
jgi:hypothetical protein